MTGNPRIRAAAVLYTQHPVEGTALSSFANQLKNRGWNVGGVVQDVLRNDQGIKIGVDAVALDTGDRFPIVRPTQEDLAASSCGLDRSVLTESSTALRRAIDNKVDILIVEKFGEREQLGEGLSDEIMNAMAEGIPVLVAVPAAAIEIWTDFTGGLADLLPSELSALQHWWGRENLYEELIRAVPAEPVKRLVVGLNWIMVEGRNGSGLSHTPSRGAGGCRSIPEADILAKKDLHELAGLAQSWNPFEAAIGIAAINAFYNRYDLDGEAVNGLDTLKNANGPVTVIGAFKQIEEKFSNLSVVEISPKDTQFPQSAAGSLLETCEGAVITASTLINRTLPTLLEHCQHNETILVGPGTPLAPALHYYGIDTLSGLVIKDVDAVAAIISAGGSVRDIKPHCRYVTLTSKFEKMGSSQPSSNTPRAVQHCC
ncbi:MAG: DUF2478 domain-containing protein [Sneathiella sp.]